MAQSHNVMSDAGLGLFMANSVPTGCSDLKPSTSTSTTTTTTTGTLNEHVDVGR